MNSGDIAGSESLLRTGDHFAGRICDIEFPCDGERRRRVIPGHHHHVDPARRHCRTASGTSGLIGSMNPTRPRRVREEARGSRQAPVLLRDRGPRRAPGSPGSQVIEVSLHAIRIERTVPSCPGHGRQNGGPSQKPLTATRTASSSRYQTAAYRCSDSKGIAATGVHPPGSRRGQPSL